jgi:hypothetical protein
MSETLVVVDAESRALTTMENPPEAVLLEAKKAAQALRDVVAQKPNKVMMNGEQYLEFEDWQTLGRFYGITAKEDGDPEFVDLGGVRGFKASAVALLRGQVISRATAYCLNDEEKWRGRTKYEYAYVLKSGGHSVEDPGKDELIWEDNPNKPGGKRPRKERIKTGEEPVPLFQMASMAQTRACAKVHRNVLSWIVVLAGYRPTPAEEMDGLAEREPASPQPAKAREASVVPSGPAGCPHCKSQNLGTANDGAAFCKDCRRGI